MEPLPLPPPPGQFPESPAWAAPPPSVPPLRYATFWIRVGAALIDGLVLLPLSLPLLIAIGNRLSNEFDRFVQTDQTVRFDAIIGDYIGWALLALLGTYAYQALMVRYFGGTLGKLAVGIRVRIAGTAAAVGWREALLRPVLQLIVGLGSFIPGAGLITILDDLWMLWDPQRQTLHDKVANTIVIYAS
jgi:uncharacterized RDD family membrane protein YckC